MFGQAITSCAKQTAYQSDRVYNDNTYRPPTTLPFGQSTAPPAFGQPVRNPFGQPTAPQSIIFNQSVASEIPCYIRTVYNTGSRYNYDHMSGEEYLLLNDLSLSIDYCQKLQRELNQKRRTIH